MDKKLLEIFDDLLDRHFPKGKCKERGEALVLVAEAMLTLLSMNGFLIKYTKSK